MEKSVSSLSDSWHILTESNIDTTTTSVVASNERDDDDNDSMIASFSSASSSAILAQSTLSDLDTTTASPSLSSFMSSTTKKDSTTTIHDDLNDLTITQVLPLIKVSFKKQKFILFLFFFLRFYYSFFKWLQNIKTNFE